MSSCVNSMLDKPFFYKMWQPIKGHHITIVDSCLTMTINFKVQDFKKSNDELFVLDIKRLLDLVVAIFCFLFNFKRWQPMRGHHVASQALFLFRMLVANTIVLLRL